MTRHLRTLAALLLLFPAEATAVSLSSLTVQPTAVTNGVASVATVTLGSAAPPGGVIVTLTSQNPAVATLPGSVTVISGARSAFFLVATNPVASSTVVAIEASYAGVTKVARLMVTPREPVRGLAGDLWADVILGKPDFSEFTPNEVVPFKVFNPGGVFVDRSVSPGRAYVWDSGNSRILGIDLATCYAGASPCSATIVIGQPSGTDHSACNGDSGFQRYPVRAPASADSLCGIPEVTLSILEWKSFVTMAANAQGDLYVPDAFNNRVLKYVSPFTTDRTADEVWGQSDFSGNLCNRGASSPTASTLCFTVTTFSAGGVDLDPAGNLWVADRGNNRVLRFPKNPITGAIAKTADIVLGQPDFVSSNAGSGPADMHSPASLRFRPNGQLYVADSENDRVLVFTPNPSFVSGMPSSSTFGSQLSAPYGLETDPAGEGLWINDTDNKMIELWDWNGSTVRKVLGKDTFRPDGQCVDYTNPQYLCISGGGIGIDTAGNVLPSIFVWNQDVVRFRAPIPSPMPGVVYAPDKRFFDPPDGYNRRGLKGLRSGAGVAIYGDQLLVADAGRVVFWNGLDTLNNGKTFDGFVGSSVFSYHFLCCGYIKTDTANRLWVQTYGEGIYAYQLPLTTEATPLARILTPGVSVPVLGGGSLTVGVIEGIVPSPQGESLWVSDTFNHRVLRIRNPLTFPAVDVVLGQTDAAGNQCNRGLVPPPNSGTEQVATADMLCHPGALSFDRLGNLFVSDHGPELEGNWRLLRFDGGLFPTNGTQPLYDVAATKVFPYRSGQPAITFEPAFDSANRMVVGYNPYLGGSFVGVYSDPAGPGTDPDIYLNDFSSWPSGIAFDANDNLYVGDQNRSRLLIYRKPLVQFSLNVVKSGAGSGTVTSTPAGIRCGTMCHGTFLTGTGVSLSPAPAASSFFAGWSGDAGCSAGVVLMSSDKTCTARFEPLPVAGNDGPICAGQTLHLTASTVVGATYSWTGPNGFVATVQNPSLPAAQTAASGTYTVIVTVNGYASPPAVTTAVVNAVPSALITAPSSIKSSSVGNTAKVPNAGAGATYSWSAAGGTITAGSGTPEITFSAGSAGSIRLSVTVTAASGCSATGLATVFVSVITGDFDGDGKSDIVWRNASTGQNALWLMNGTSFKSIVDLPALPNTNYHMKGMGDFNGDGKLDIVWRNSATGQNAVWLMNGTSLMSIVDLPALPNLDYDIEAIGDLNHDGMPDIIWRNSATGQNAVWLMNGTSLASIVDLPALPNLNYHIEGVADMSGDANCDILWRNAATGQNAVWVMNGTSLATIVNLPALPNPSYRVGAFADYTGDGNVDIVWRNYATGQNAVWVMNGTSLSGIVDLPALPNLNYVMEGKK